MKEKRCSKCGEFKSIEEFHKSSRDGYQSRCKNCRKIDSIKNITKKKQYDKVRYTKNRTKIKNQSKKYRNEHKDYYRRYNRIYQNSYYSTENGRLKRLEIVNKRQRNLKFIPLFDNPFPDEVDIDYHHINNLLVIPIPRLLHQINNSNSQLSHRNKCNDCIKDLYYLDLESLLN